jgi:hypothetical protein
MADRRAQHETQSPPLDTSLSAWNAMRNRLAALQPGEEAQLANEMSIDCERLARAGIAMAEPSASQERIRYLLTARRYGTEFADTALGSGPC